MGLVILVLFWAVLQLACNAGREKRGAGRYEVNSALLNSEGQVLKVWNRNIQWLASTTRFALNRNIKTWTSYFSCELNVYKVTVYWNDSLLFLEKHFMFCETFHVRKLIFTIVFDGLQESATKRKYFWRIYLPVDVRINVDMLLCNIYFWKVLLSFFAPLFYFTVCL